MDFENLCRTCLVTLSKAMAKYSLRTVLDLKQKLAKCTGRAVDAGDSLPQQLCLKCYRKLNQCYEFYKMCAESMKRLTEWQQEHEFVDEKPEYDLEVQLDMQLVVGDTDNLPQNDSFKSYTSKRSLDNNIPLPEDALHESFVDIEAMAGEQQTDDIESHISEDVFNASSYTVEDEPIKKFPKRKNGCVKTRSSARKQAPQKQRKLGHETPPYPCTQNGCKKTFQRRLALTKHLKSHSGNKEKYVCKEAGCERTYKHKHTLQLHARRVHKVGREIKTHVCEICGKVFKAASILKDHCYTHKTESELPYGCNQEGCQRRFSNKEKLKVHLRRHAGIKNFVCTYCGMRKTTQNELKIHINYHTLERQWTCSFCDHVFNSAGNLKMHVRTVHERARDYACSFCNKSFGKKDTLKYHEMRHTGEKPCKCVECGKFFSQPAALRQHKKIHWRQKQQADTAGAVIAESTDETEILKETVTTTGQVRS